MNGFRGRAPVTSQRWNVIRYSVAIFSLQEKPPGLTISTKPCSSNSLSALAAVAREMRSNIARTLADIASLPLFRPLYLTSSSISAHRAIGESEIHAGEARRYRSKAMNGPRLRFDRPRLSWFAMPLPFAPAFVAENL